MEYNSKKPQNLHFSSTQAHQFLLDDEDSFYEVVIDSYHYEDHGIGEYNFWGMVGYSSVPVIIVDSICIISKNGEILTLDEANRENSQLDELWNSGVITATCDYVGSDDYV